MSTVLSGKELAASIRAGVAADAAALTARGVTPTLAIVTATDDGGSAWYVSSIVKAAAKVGIEATVVDLLATPERLTDELRRLGADPSVHGTILQTPLPGGASLEELAGAIPPAKDVDGASPESLGRLVAGLPAFAPATAAAVLALLDHHGVDLEGRHAVVIGRSTVVGKPAAHLLLDRHATVTVCHSRTVDLPAIAATGDVLVAAVGRPRLVTAEFVKPGATVIDVGTNDTSDGLVGDVDADSVADRAGGLSPVPGGVGPVTTALLLRHTVDAATATVA